MSECPFPPEILDLIVDFLHDDPDALKACCVASQSWVHRSRKHLFAYVKLLSLKSHFQLWEKIFPEPSISPARYARSLLIRGLPVGNGPDMDVGEWIRTFRNVVHLHVDTLAGSDSCLTPLRGFSSTLKSIRLTLADTPQSEVFGLVCSFPLLEDLVMASLDGDSGVDGWSVPSTSPKFTGSLDLRILYGAQPIIRRLLELPGGLHFTKIAVSCIEEDNESTMNLVSRCSETLESLRINYYVASPSWLPPFDLSKLAKLREVVFGCHGPTIQWVTVTLQSIESTNLRQIVIHAPRGFRDLIGETVHQEWQELDRVLLGYWNSHSIRPKIRCVAREGPGDLRVLAPKLFPGLLSREVLDFAED